MNKNKTLQNINDQIDKLIIAGKTNTEQFKNLTKLHKAVVKTYELRTTYVRQ